MIPLATDASHFYALNFTMKYEIWKLRKTFLCVENKKLIGFNFILSFLLWLDKQNILINVSRYFNRYFVPYI